MKKSKRNLSALLSFIMSVVSVGVAPVKALDNEFDDDDILNTDLGESMNGYSSLVDSGSVLAGVAVFALAGSLIGKRLYLNSGARAIKCLEGTATFMTDQEKRLVYNTVLYMAKYPKQSVAVKSSLNEESLNEFLTKSKGIKIALYLKSLKGALMLDYLKKLSSYRVTENIRLNKLLESARKSGEGGPRGLTVKEVEELLAACDNCVNDLVQRKEDIPNLTDDEKKNLEKVKDVVSYISKMAAEDIWTLYLKVTFGSIAAGADEMDPDSKTITWYKTEEHERIQKDQSNTILRQIKNIKINS